jgi:hypothetical protein
MLDPQKLFALSSGSSASCMLAPSTFSSAPFGWVALPAGQE